MGAMIALHALGHQPLKERATGIETGDAQPGCRWGRYGISRAHWAESVYCWNDVIRSPLKP